MISVYIILGRFALCVIGVAVICILGKRIKKYRQENTYLLGEIEKAAWRVKKLEEASQKNRSVEEAANGERKELAGTPDGELVDRANGLFNGGVRDKAKGVGRGGKAGKAN